MVWLLICVVYGVRENGSRLLSCFMLFVSVFVQQSNNLVFLDNQKSYFSKQISFELDLH
jgi:hypothetical protein